LKKGHIPERTCILCRKKTSKWELFRLCVKDGKVVLDKKQTLGGRGAYLCEKCIKEFKKKLNNKKVRSKLFYALRIKGPVEVDF